MFGLNHDKLAIQCHLCVKRMALVRNRRTQQMYNSEQEVADILEAGQEQNARIRVEEVIRQEFLLEGYAILETYLMLLQTRAGMLKKAKDPPPDMTEAICTIIFASERVKFDLDEMPAIASILMSKFKSSFCQLYGKDFPQAIHSESAAYERRLPIKIDVASCLSVASPSPSEKLKKLDQIAAKFGAPFDAERAALNMLPKNPRMPAQDFNQQQIAPPPTKVYVQQPVAPMPSLPAASKNNVPPTRPSPVVPPPAAVAAAAPSPPENRVQTHEGITLDGWAPLPPLNQDLGYDWNGKLDQYALYMNNKRSESQSPGVSEGTPIRGNSLHADDFLGARDHSGSVIINKSDDPAPETEGKNDDDITDDDDMDDLAKKIAELRGL